jgi:hypothetical protein
METAYFRIDLKLRRRAFPTNSLHLEGQVTHHLNHELDS